ncbi:hypothetical protein [Cohnella algarum]|uniref:hypothetical protein n=1 Tax=Cohnella algarum TaxID=2044859 RepID=UPI00308428DF
MAVKKKLVVLFVIDLLIVWFSSYTAYFFRFEGRVPGEYIGQFLEYSLLSSGLCLIVMLYLGMYRSMWKYASIRELLTMCQAVVISWGAAYLITLLYMDHRVPLSVAVRTLETSLLLMGERAYFGAC